MDIFAVLKEILPLVGSAIALPIIQELLKKYIPEKWRHIVAGTLAFGASVFWALVLQGSWEITLLNFSVVYGLSQTFFQKIIKNWRSE
ncbi:MAG: hypothetical protein ACOZBH_04560 [Patescibacteria group bacterium]